MSGALCRAWKTVVRRQTHGRGAEASVVPPVIPGDRRQDEPELSPAVSPLLPVDAREGFSEVHRACSKVSGGTEP